MVKPLVTQLEFNRATLLRNVGDLSHEESVTFPPSGVNCLNWVVGHVVATRDRLLRGLGAPAVWSEAEAKPYGGGRPAWATGQGAKPFPQVREAFEQSQELLRDSLQRLSAEELGGPPPLPEGNADDLESFLGAFFCHEAYHVGQTGLLRRLLGHPGALGQPPRS